MMVHTIPIMKEECFVVALVVSFLTFLPGWEVEKEGKGLFWRGACLLRGVSSLPAIKRKLRVNPPSLPRLITIYPHPDLKVKSQKKMRLKIIVIFFQTHFNCNFDLSPPTPLFSFRMQTAVSAEILTRLQLYFWNFDFSLGSSTSCLPHMCLHQNSCQRGRRDGEKDKKNEQTNNCQISLF